MFNHLKNLENCTGPKEVIEIIRLLPIVVMFIGYDGDVFWLFITFLGQFIHSFFLTSSLNLIFPLDINLPSNFT